MAVKNNATCSICGNSYYKCLSCRDSIKLHPYKSHCCSANCYKVFQIVRGYNVGVYKKDELKFKLKNVDLSNLENYEESLRVLIKDVLKENKIETVVEADEIAKETTDNIVAEEEIVVREVEATMPRKRNKINKVEETE